MKKQKRQEKKGDNITGTLNEFSSLFSSIWMSVQFVQNHAHLPAQT